MNKIFRVIQQFLFPAYCTLCETYNADLELLCAPCKKELPWINQSCEQCGDAIAESSVTICGSCLSSPPEFDRLFSLFQFEEPVISLIHELKFQEKLYQARLFGQLLAEKISTVWYKDLTLPEVIIPIPLYKTRLQERGFNQAVEIARLITKELKIPIDKKICQRIKATEPQANLAANKRGQNIKNAFSCVSTIPYKHIAILDDVVTTGNTVAELAKVLKKAGVGKIDVWCCARRQL